jgi:hypothetical protein
MRSAPSTADSSIHIRIAAEDFDEHGVLGEFNQCARQAFCECSAIQLPSLSTMMARKPIALPPEEEGDSAFPLTPERTDDCEL